MTERSTDPRKGVRWRPSQPELGEPCDHAWAVLNNEPSTCMKCGIDARTGTTLEPRVIVIPTPIV